jgi:hypothetical protein
MGFLPGRRISGAVADAFVRALCGPRSRSPRRGRSTRELSSNAGEPRRTGAAEGERPALNSSSDGALSWGAYARRRPSRGSALRRDARRAAGRRSHRQPWIRPGGTRGSPRHLIHPARATTAARRARDTGPRDDGGSDGRWSAALGRRAGQRLLLHVLGDREGRRPASRSWSRRSRRASPMGEPRRPALTRGFRRPWANRRRARSRSSCSAAAPWGSLGWDGDRGHRRVAKRRGRPWRGRWSRAVVAGGGARWSRGGPS